MNAAEIGIEFITLESGLRVAKYPITRRQWIAVMGEGTEPQKRWEASHFKNDGPDSPATFVSALDADEFCQRLDDGSRLPTPNEQAEYIYPLSEGFPIDDHCVYGLDYDQGPPAVGSKKPMENGLYDTHGLVYEWCSE